MKFSDAIAPRILATSILCAALAACGGSSATSAVTGYKIALPTGASGTVNAGDALRLSVEQVHSDGSTDALPGAATVSWSGAPTVAAVPAASATSATPNPIPAFGATPTAIFISNSARTDAVDLANVLFFIDAGTTPNQTITVTATIANATPGGTASTTFTVGAALAGDAANGANVYGAQGANCAACHGATGAGTPQNPDGTYTIDTINYPYPAPGLNAIAGNVAANPTWNQALLAMAARADMNNAGIELRLPMLDWLTGKNALTAAPPTTQEFADIYAYMKTQTQ